MFPCLPLLAAISLASAQETSSEAPLPPAPTPPVADEAEPKKRKFLMEVGFRARYMDVPDTAFDFTHFSNRGDEDESDTIPNRPHFSGYSLGIEFVIKDKQANGIFYVEYLNPIIRDPETGDPVSGGYFDDKEEPPDHLDGSWLEFEKFGLVLIGANYAYELRATNWLSFMFGAGIGSYIKVGQVRQWQAGEDPADPNHDNNNTDVDCGSAGTADAAAYVRKDKCEDDGLVDIPPAFPYLDVNIGVRFNISDRASIRLEGGLHPVLPYGGASVGIVF